MAPRAVGEAKGKIDVGVPGQGMSPWPRWGTPVVYVILDRNMDPLYAGCSTDLAKRLATHRKRPWFEKATAVTWRRTAAGPCKISLFTSERHVIMTLDPPHNRHGAYGNDVAERFQANLRTRADRYRRFPDVKYAGSAEDKWIEAILDHSLARGRRHHLVAITPGPVGRWSRIPRSAA